jgi:hypothetical protein
MAISTTEQDFFDIKNNLKVFLGNQSQFADYDFDGSAMSTLLDVLAYNTHYNAITASMSVNEMFLDTAQLRHNVVSHAKSLGYTPRSVRSSNGSISLTADVSNSPDKITIPRGTTFNGPNGVKFNTISDYITTVTGSSIAVSDITVYEGKFISNSYVVDSGRQVYRIPNKSCDMTTLRVKVYKDSTLTDFTTYIESKTLIGHNSTSAIYFTQEGIDENFEVYFGDDIIGKKLEIGNVVELEYLKSSGDIANGITTMSSGSSVTNLTNIAITLTDKTSGGAGIETIESIKKNAPYLYTAQNRTVTINDYKSLLKNHFSFIEDMTVWGGEDNIPPEYGKVFLSVDTSSNTALTSLEKTSILQELNKFKLTSILPEFVTPDYTNLVLNVKFTFNSLVTSNTATGLSSLISDKIVAFNAELAKFDTSYYNSDIISLILAADPSIVSATVNHTANKSITSFTNVTSKYTFNFNNAIYHPHEYHTTSALKGVVSSDGFNITNSTYTHFLEDDGIGKIKLSYISDEGATVIVNNQIGTVDYTTGEIIISEISISSATLKMNVHLDSFDVIPLRNDIITISDTTISGTQLTSKLGIQTTETNYTASPARL